MDNLIEFNDGSVKAVQDGSLTKLIITGEVEIELNGDIIYSPHNKKEYRLLPQILIPFIDKYQEYINDEGDHFDIDLCIDGKIVTVYVPKNKKKKTFAARYDTSEKDAVSKLEDYDYTKEEIAEFQDSYDKMINQLNELGYKLKYSHSQEEFIWCWSDIKFDIKSFNEEDFIKVSKIIFEHDAVIKKLYDKK